MILAIACGFLFDDPAARLTETVPQSFRVRRLLRMFGGFVAAATLETSAFVLLAFATAAVLTRITRNEPGNLAAPILLGGYAVSG